MSISPRLDRAIRELGLVARDTCPCKREVILVEALHGYAETRGHRMEPAFIERDGHISFSPLPASGGESARSVHPDERLRSLEALLGEPVAPEGHLPRTRVSAAALEKTLRKAFALPEDPLPAGIANGNP